MNMKSVPILVGAAQITQRKEADSVVDPLCLMIQASRRALADASAGSLPHLIDTVCVVKLKAFIEKREPEWKNK
jgi:hypothetical protein